MLCGLHKSEFEHLPLEVGNNGGTLLTIIALLGLTGFALAQNSSMPDQTGSTAQQEQQTDAASAQHQSARSFEGTIEKASGKLVLQEA